MMCDITFCNRKCANKECERNLKYIKDKITVPYISISRLDKCTEFVEDKRK